MSERKEVYIFGYSGHSYVVLDVATENGYRVKGYFDYKENRRNPYNLEFLGYEKEVNVKQIIESGLVFPSVGSNAIRKKLIQLFNKEKLEQTSLVSKNAFISPSATIMNSVFVAPSTTINSLVEIGNGCIINSGAILEHECVIGDYSHVAPGAILAGNVSLGSECFVGAGAVIKEGIQITDNVIIGAGTIVVKDILQEGVYVGNPSRKLKD